MTGVRLAARVVAVYVVIGCAWIFLSDWIVFSGASLEQARLFQTVKGVCYVLATAGLLFWLIRRGSQYLGESETRFRFLVEQAPDAVFVQQGGRIAYANGAAARLLGVGQAHALIGREVVDFVHPTCRDLVLRRISQVTELDQPVLGQEEVFLRGDGATAVCEVSAVPVRYQGRKGSIVFARDATEKLKSLERQVLAQKIEASRKISGGLAHDFNNLLQVINGYTELACEALPDDAQGRSYLELVRVSGRRASDLVSQLLAFSSGKAPHLEGSELSSLGGATVGALQQLIGAHLPKAAPSDESGPVPACELMSTGLAGGSHGRTILIAEDDVMVRRLTARILMRAGYNILEAADGAAAVQLFERHRGQVAAVVLDIVMPKMGGFEAYDRVRAIETQVPILFASGFSGFTTPPHITLTPGVNFLQKPFESHVLLAVIKQAVGGSATGAAAKA